METKKVRQASVLNWLGTIILSSIPVINIVFFIFTAIFAATESKRRYAKASLLFVLLVAVILCASWFIFGEALVTWAQGVLSLTEAM